MVSSKESAQFALPFPSGINLTVFRDDGRWGEYRAWFLRPMWQVQDLLVARITLGHLEGSDEPAYDCDSWRRKAEALVQKYPGCIFVYATDS